MKASVYTPGAGHRPPYLAGRDEVRQHWDLMLNDVVTRGRRRAEDTVLVGSRGVGKTSLLTALSDQARDQGFEVISLQAVVGQAGVVETFLDEANALMDKGGPWSRARTALARVSTISAGAAGISGSVSTRPPETSVPRYNARSLAGAWASVAEEVRKDQPNGGLLLTLDEMQVATDPDIAILAAALHRLNVDHSASPVVFAATGLPVVTNRLREAGVTHPDRLFVMRDVPATLTEPDTASALIEPARAEHVVWEPEAVRRVREASNGYPAHVQLIADAAWRQAPGPNVITVGDVESALPAVFDALERQSLGPRWDRLSDRQAEYLAAIALNGGTATTADVRRILNRAAGEVSWVRDELIREGDVYSPRYGHVALTVPVMARYVLQRYNEEQHERGDHVLTLEQMTAHRDTQPPS